MTKEKPRAATTQRQKIPFVPCRTVTGGGPFHGGTECIDGLRLYQTMHNGKMERFARDCECKIAWRKRKAEAA